MAKDALLHDIWASAEQLSTAEEFERFLEKWQKTALSEQASARSSLNAAMTALVEHSRNDPSVAEAVIKKYVLPSCLERSGAVLLSVFNVRETRELLSNWLSQYPDETRIPLRSKILALLQGRPSVASIKTIAAIGFRSPWAEKTLPVLLEKDGTIGEAAITALCVLSPMPALRKLLTTKVLARVSHTSGREWDYAMQELASSRFIPIVARRLIERADIWDAAYVLGRIASAFPGDDSRQRRIWKAFEQAMVKMNEVITPGNTLANCNSEFVVSWLLSRVEKPGFALHLVSNHLKDCFRPHQLKGWQSADKFELKTRLHQYMSAPGGRSLSMTVSDHNRRQAWEIALSAGITDLSDWIPQTTESPGRLSDALSYASYIPITEPPPLVHQLVTEPVDITNSDLLFSARLAASRVLAASETVMALESLTNCGITARGAPLQRIAEIIEDVVDRLSAHSAERVLKLLLHASEDRRRSGARMFGIAGLQRLAVRELIPDGYLDRILSLTADSSLPDYAVAGAIWVAASLPAAANNQQFVHSLLHNIVRPDASHDIQFQSIQALIRLGIWRDNLVVVLTGLDFAMDNLQIKESNVQGYFGWQAYAVGLLLMRAPEMFRTAAEQIIAGAQGATVYLLLRALEESDEARSTCVRDIARLAVARSMRVLGRSFGETDNFRSIARLNGRALVEADWETVWGEWMPQVRAALADAVRNIPEHERPAERTAQLLEMLIGDSTYLVRRAAARTYSSADPGRLRQLCARWRSAGNTELRVRCAEVAQWFPANHAHSIDNKMLRHLLLDPEPSVRAAASRSVRDLRRREWLNAALAFLKEVDRNDGERYIARCYCYGRAIVALGDDDTGAELSHLIDDTHTPINIRNWLEHIFEDLKKRWEDDARKWPEPISVWSGQIEELNTRIDIEGRSFETKISLWQSRPTDPADKVSWGGAFFEPSFAHPTLELINRHSSPIGLRIQGRRAAQIWYGAVTFEREVFFIGTGQYPEPTTGREPDSV